MIARLARLLVLAVLAALALVRGVPAHEVRPAFLQLTETGAGEFDVLWKLPALGEYQLALAPEFSARTEVLGPVATELRGAAVIETWRLRALDSLPGSTIRIAGLERTATDAVVRIAFAGGRVWTARVRPQSAAVAIPEAVDGLALALAYGGLGVEHILLGIDHLLFVLGLLLITGGGWRLVQTVTAFTVAHSITLGLAALGYVTVPVAPVEAAIALSILFLGPEIVRVWQGGTSLAIRRPWIVAFGFGLLHGFGFAGGLSLDGMAPSAIPQALLWFNLGVEAGQLAFIAAVFAAMALLRLVPREKPLWVLRAPGYAVGIAGAFWSIERTTAVLDGRLW